MKSREEEPAGSTLSLQRPVSPAQPDCILTIGAQRLAAILAEEWDSGLYVLIQASPSFWVEDTGSLQTSEAELMVRVSNIVRLGGDDNDAVSTMPVFRVGLERLSQRVVKLAPQPAPAATESVRPKLLSHLPLDRMRISVGGLIALSLIGTPLVLAVVAWRHNSPQTDSADLTSVVLATPVSPSSTLAADLQPAIVAKPAAPGPTPEILRLPGVEPFLKVEVVQKLELTPSQMGTFGRINQTTQEALADLEKYWESDGRLELAERRNVLLKAARQEALQVLTNRQRQTWEAMTR